MRHILLTSCLLLALAGGASAQVAQTFTNPGSLTQSAAGAPCPLVTLRGIYAPGGTPGTVLAIDNTTANNWAFSGSARIAGADGVVAAGTISGTVPANNTANFVTVAPTAAMTAPITMSLTFHDCRGSAPR